MPPTDATPTGPANSAADTSTARSDTPSASSERAMSRAAHLHSLLGVPPTDGNEITVLRNGDEIFASMLEGIRGARSTVDLVTFVYWAGDVADRFADTLSAAARRGCRVRVLLDAIGSRRMDRDLIERMLGDGVDVRVFRPIVDGPIPDVADATNRTHRKILVCDGRVGFCGGVGIADEWAGDARNEDEWRDTHLRVEGPAVAGLNAAFLENWADDHDQAFEPSDEPGVRLEPAGDSTCMVIRGSAGAGASDMWRLTLALIGSATQRVRIASAYFNPDERMHDALLEAVGRGVDLSILVPGPHADKRFVQIAGEAAYEELLDGGVEIKAFEPSMMHAKIITVDGVVATVGSANFNQRSMRHDDEANVVIFDPAVVTVLERQFDDDVERSVDLDPSRWRERSAIQKAAERLSGVADRWL